MLQQTVTDGDAGAIVWHVVIDDGEVRLHPGPSADPTVTFACDRPTAFAIQAGRSSAQAAFMAGRLRLGGDIDALLRHQSTLSALTDALAAVRASTAA